jgi:hypothetical protein
MALHQRQTTNQPPACDKDRVKHILLAISKLKDEIESAKAAEDIPSTINAVVLLAFLAVRPHSPDLWQFDVDFAQYFQGEFQAGGVHRKALERLFTLISLPTQRAEWDERFGSLMLQYVAFTAQFGL